MKKFVFAALTLLVATPAFSAEVTVIVEGVTAQRGTMRCGLHVTGETFPNQKPKVGAQVKVDDGTVRCAFGDVAPGTYAVAVMQDLNGNEKMDTTWVGAPDEPWGVSKNVPAKTFGPPEFDAAKFVVAEAPVTLRVRLNQP